MNPATTPDCTVLGFPERRPLASRSADAMRTGQPEHMNMSLMNRGLAARAFEPLPDDVTHCSLVDPHDETVEIEITEEMVSLALDAIEDEQIWPYASDRAVVAQPVRSATILRFPGC